MRFFTAQCYDEEQRNQALFNNIQVEITSQFLESQYNSKLFIYLLNSIFIYTYAYIYIYIQKKTEHKDDTFPIYTGHYSQR
jgi:hypothetical protein